MIGVSSSPRICPSKFAAKDKVPQKECGTSPAGWEKVVKVRYENGCLATRLTQMVYGEALRQLI